METISERSGNSIIAEKKRQQVMTAEAELSTLPYSILTLATPVG